MKKIIVIITILSFMFYCKSPMDKSLPNRKIIDGVEIISNGGKPFRGDKKYKNFKIKELFDLDTEDEKYVHLGITRIMHFDVDLEDNIFISDGRNIWKFDNCGEFIQKIGNSGEGPGEFKYVEDLRITKSNRISLYDPISQKFLFFTTGGTFEEEIKLSGFFTYKGFFLDNGNFLVLNREEITRAGKRMFYYVLLDERFNIIRDLKPSYSIDLFDKSLKMNLMDYSICIQVINDMIFIASNMSDNVEIYIYDLQGNLKRIVKQKSKRIKLSKEFKQKILNKWEKTPVWETVKFKYYFPRFFPPFRSFWVDKELGILVEKYIAGDSPEEYVVDLFNSEGIYIKRLSLVKARLRKFKNGFMYCVNEKESGFSKINVYKLNLSE